MRIDSLRVVLVLILLGTGSSTAQDQPVVDAGGKPDASGGYSACNTCCNTCCADSYCCSPYDCCCCDPWRICEQDPCGWNFFGWADGGYVYNSHSPNSKFNGPYNAVDRANEPVLNQFYLIGQKCLVNDCGV